MFLQICGMKIVVMNSKETIREALVTQSEAFADRFLNYRFQVVFRGGRGIIFHQYDEEFKTLKKQAFQSLRAYGDGLSKLEAISQDILEDYMEHIKPEEKEAHDLSKDFYMAVSNIIMSMVRFLFLERHTITQKEHDCTIWCTLLDVQLSLKAILYTLILKIICVLLQVLGKKYDWFAPESLHLKELQEESQQLMMKPSGILYDFFPFLHSLYENKCLKDLIQNNDNLVDLIKKNVQPLEV